MHSEHRRRYHLRPLADVHPGDRVSLDETAIRLVSDDQEDQVNWARVDRDASQVLDRMRPSPDRITLDVRDGAPGSGSRRHGLEGHTAAPLLVWKPANSY